MTVVAIGLLLGCVQQPAGETSAPPGVTPGYNNEIPEEIIG